MKRIFVLLLSVTTALSSYAYYNDYSSSNGLLTFMSIIMIIWGILEIILFFKIWGMTNDIKALKKDYLNEYNYETQGQLNVNLRKYLVLGDIGKVKYLLFKDFNKEVECAFGKMKSCDFEKDENGNYNKISYAEKNLQESILPYVNKLQKKLELIDEDLPIYIKKMKTFNDYFNLFEEEKDNN